MKSIFALAAAAAVFSFADAAQAQTANLRNEQAAMNLCLQFILNQAESGGFAVTPDDVRMTINVVRLGGSDELVDFAVRSADVTATGSCFVTGRSNNAFITDVEFHNVTFN